MDRNTGIGAGLSVACDVCGAPLRNNHGDTATFPGMTAAEDAAWAQGWETLEPRPGHVEFECDGCVREDLEHDMENELDTIGF